MNPKRKQIGITIMQNRPSLSFEVNLLCAAQEGCRGRCVTSDPTTSPEDGISEAVARAWQQGWTVTFSGKILALCPDCKQINGAMKRRYKQDRFLKVFGWLAYAVGSFAVGIAVGQVLAATVEPSRAAVIFSAAIGGVVVWLLREIFKPL